MKLRQISFTTFNLYNLNEPGLPLYRGEGWTKDEYDRKIAWTARMLQEMPATVYGFQEMWHPKSVENAVAAAGRGGTHRVLSPAGHAGKSIVCGAAVQADLLIGEPEWITKFPDGFHLSSGGGDPQTTPISINIRTFSRPVLHFVIRPRTDQPDVHVYVCHFKSKLPTEVRGETWYEQDVHSKHASNIGSALSTIRRTAEASALRFLLTQQMKETDTPVVLLGDVNDGHESNTVALLSAQPTYLAGLKRGGRDDALYAGQTLQEYRSTRDVYYTHIHNDMRESLDQIMFSEEFYDNSRKRIWEFKGLEVRNDHLNRDDQKEMGTGDHGIVRVTFGFAPAKKEAAEA